MKYSVKITLVVLFSVIILSGCIWVFSSAERQYALNQYLDVNQKSTNTVQYSLQANIDDYTDAEHKVDYVGLVNSLPKFDFSSVTILNNNGTVLASTDENIIGAYIFSLGDDGKDAFFKEAGANIMINGNMYYFAKIDSADYRVMCITLGGDFANQTSSISALTIVEVIIILLIIAICITLVIIFYKQKFNVLYRVKPVNNYTLSTTKYGRLLYADDNFNNTFGKVKFHECFLNKDVYLREALTSGNLMLFEIPTKKGDLKQIAFNATRGLGEYKLVGSDVTAFMTKYNTLLRKFRTDAQTGLDNYYEFDKDWKYYLETDKFKEGLICFFGIPNIDYYRTLYGEQAFEKGLKFIAHNIKYELREYGKLYSVKGEVFLLIQTKELRDRFINNINQIQERLSSTIEIFNNYIKLDIRLGAVYLSALQKDTKFVFVFNAGLRALRYAKEIENVPYYIQRVTAFESGSYQLITYEMLNDLIEKGSIDIYFQPQVDIKKEKVVGLEALFRFTDPKIQDMNVFEFIATVEKSGLIVELGEFIYKRAMDFASIVQKLGITVSINISPIQLMQMGFVEKFLEEYHKRNIKPGIVHVEIVESTMIYSMNDVINKLEALKAQGIESEVDDFGIAYSSLLYLKKLPISTIKIDKAFIDNIEHNEKDQHLLKNIINIVKDFDLTCVAEGVEREGQRAIVKKLGCDVIQGYYYSKALPKEKAFEYIKKMNKIEEK